MESSVNPGATREKLVKAIRLHEPMCGMCMDMGMHVYRHACRYKEEARGPSDRRAGFINWACKYEQKRLCV